jgi:preprotein translocase SecE subunit
MAFFRQAWMYVKDVWYEGRRVQWPDKKTATQYTLIVIGASAVTAALLGSIDYLFTTVMQNLVL